MTGSFYRYVLLSIICSFFLKAKLVRESSEVPYFREPNLSKLKKKKLKIEYSFFDGVIVISERLQKFYLEELALKIKIICIPILVSKDRILEPEREINKSPNFVYTGSLIDDKDGVLSIIKAFSMVVVKYSNVRMTMTGDIQKSPDKEKILSLIHSLSLKNKIDLVGYISKKELEEITLNATALVVAKPENRQNRYNMATKIGEYLLTGRPVVVSSVDPVCHFLSHRQSAFIVNPIDKLIARELEFILNNPKKANHIGLMGRIVAISNFDYKKQALKLDDTFRELLK